MTATDPKPTAAPGASTVSFFSRQLLDRNMLGANHAPANKMEKAVRIVGGLFIFKSLGARLHWATRHLVRRCFVYDVIESIRGTFLVKPARKHSQREIDLSEIQ